MRLKSLYEIRFAANVSNFPYVSAFHSEFPTAKFVSFPRKKVAIIFIDLFLTLLHWINTTHHSSALTANTNEFIIIVLLHRDTDSWLTDMQYQTGHCCYSPPGGIILNGIGGGGPNRLGIPPGGPMSFCMGGLPPNCMGGGLGKRPPPGWSGRPSRGCWTQNNISKLSCSFSRAVFNWACRKTKTTSITCLWDYSANLKA